MTTTSDNKYRLYYKILVETDVLPDLEVDILLLLATMEDSSVTFSSSSRTMNKAIMSTVEIVAESSWHEIAQLIKDIAEIESHHSYFFIDKEGYLGQSDI